jgi:hypothetical protein
MVVFTFNRVATLKIAAGVGRVRLSPQGKQWK